MNFHAGPNWFNGHIMVCFIELLIVLQVIQEGYAGQKGPKGDKGERVRHWKRLRLIFNIELYHVKYTSIKQMTGRKCLCAQCDNTSHSLSRHAGNKWSQRCLFWHILQMPH